MLNPARIRGRFAPSPTGFLHFGSLIAALGSYVDAKSQGGQWLVRIEDVDETRAIPAMADKILRQLESFGFGWDSEILVQSANKQRYAEIFAELRQKQLIYPCFCSRKQIAAIAENGIEGPIYPGTCRPVKGASQANIERTKHAWRIQVNDHPMQMEDRIYGVIKQNLASDLGDFVVKRSDGFTAYQLAVVIDDADQGINSVVRGQDLLLSTPRQIYLQTLLGFSQPTYAHLPLALTKEGKKISKSDAAHPVDTANPLSALNRAWHFLKQNPIQATNPDDFLTQAIAHWAIDKIKPPKLDQAQE